MQFIFSHHMSDHFSSLIFILQVIRTVPLTHWATSLDMCPTTALLAVGIKGKTFTSKLELLSASFIHK